VRLLFITLFALLIAGCTGPSSLPAGLTERMDAPGARLNKAEALAIVNQLRSSRGAQALVLDDGLNAEAETLAARYAGTGNAPQKPEGAGAMRVSAGYANFAETFSGWRSRTDDAGVLADPAYQRAGFGVSYSSNSTYGVHWVLLLTGSN
jgi:uncharacterized protein YkwD